MKDTNISDSIWVIILNWNGWLDTKSCIYSLLNQDCDDIKIVVVDNASKDHSVSELTKHFGDNIRIIVNETNLGFSGGNNIGIEYALDQGAEYILLLNNDTIASDKRLVRKLVGTLKGNPDIGLASPTIYHYGDPQKLWYAGARFSFWRGEASVATKRPQTNQIRNTGFATGCCTIASSKHIEEIGLLDEDFFLYQEDVDWSLRAQKTGLRVVYVPEVQLEHKISSSTMDPTGNGVYSPATVYYQFRSRILLVRKHGNLAQKYLIWPTLIGIRVTIHFFAYCAYRRWNKIQSMFRGLYDGMATRL